jgi:hypothetical protein
VKTSWLVGFHSRYQPKKLKLEITWFLLEVLVEQIGFYAGNIEKTPNYEGGLQFPVKLPTGHFEMLLLQRKSIQAILTKWIFHKSLKTIL